MPLTVSDLLKNVGLKVCGVAKWGERISDNLPGIYIVSLSDNPNSLANIFEQAPLSLDSIHGWLDRVPMLQVDRRSPTAEILAKRLSQFWFPDETILYIGKASRSVRQRVRQYYNTDLGYPRPHAGGHWLKTLSILDQLYVYWALTETPEDKETQLLQLFMQDVSSRSKAQLHDDCLALPFANLEIRINENLYRKRHGISRQVNRNI
jgi:hypothetical protein